MYLMVPLFLYIAIYILYRATSFNKQPPGPWGLPILGHVPFLGRNPANKFMQWKKIYGPIFSVKLGSNPVVVLNDVKLIKEALNLDTISGRPLLANFAEMSQQKGIAFTNGVRTIEQRKFVLDSFKELGVMRGKMEFSMQEEIKIFLANLSQKCKNYNEVNKNEAVHSNEIRMQIKHFFLYPIINALWIVIAAERFEEGSKKLVNLFDLLAKVTDTNTTVLAKLSWFFPWISNALTFFGLNEVVNSYRGILNYMNVQIELQRENYVPGQPNHFIHSYFDKEAETLDPQSSFYATRKEQPHTLLEIFSGAIDPATSSLDLLLLYLAKDEKVQVKLQVEIDSIVGLSELPSCTHRARMPYTEAVIHELLRITSIAPFGVYRRALEDIDFHGYRIPKDAMVIANQYGVHHDPDVWNEPNNFKPERFLKENGTLNKLHTELVPFGYGKRICIGETFARDVLFIFITCFFQKFSVKCTINIPSLKQDFGLFMMPKAFELIISERLTITK